MKRILILTALLLGILAGIILFRDPIISRILPIMASSRGINLKTNCLHLNLSPFTLDVQSLEMGWKRGHVHMEGVKVYLSTFSLFPKEAYLDKCEIKVKLVAAKGANLPLLPSTLRRLDIKNLNLTLKSSWGWGKIIGGRVLLDSEEFSLTGGLAAGARRGRKAFQGHFSFSGERKDLSRGEPRGRGLIIGQFSWGHKKVKGTLRMPHLAISPSMKLEASGFYLTLPSLFSFKGDLHLARGDTVIVGDGHIPSLKVLRGFFPQVPKGVEGSLYFSGKMTKMETLQYTLAVLGKGFRLKNMGGLKDLEASLEGNLEGKEGEGIFHLKDLHLKRVVFSKVEEKGWRGTGDLSWNRWGKNGISMDLCLNKGKRDVELKFSLPALALKGAKVKAETKGVTLEDLQPFIASFYPSLGNKANLKGPIKIQGDASFQKGRWITSIWCYGRNISFSAPKGNGGEGLMVQGDFTAPQGLAQGPWRVSLRLSKGEILALPWYFDFSQMPWSFTLILGRRRDRVCILRAQYKGLAQATFEGLFCPPQRVKGTLSLYGDAGTLYSQLVAEPLEEEEPLLGEIRLKGRVGARLFLKDRGKWRVSGPITWTGKVEGKGFSLQGALSFPLIYRPQGKGEGSLRISSFALGPIKIKNWATPLEGFPYGVRGIRGINFPLWKGRVSSGSFILLYRDSHQSQMKVDGLMIQGIQPPWIPLPVVMEGSFSRLEAGPKEIRFNGEVKAILAKGEVKVKNIWISYPFTSLMRIGCDVTFSHLDLEELTGITPFGRMTGYIKGFIKNLVMSHGQPEAFQLEIETQEVKGIRKRISLKAINSISILGGGGPVSLFLPFFKEFSYKYLGLSCSLRNDIFSLHGLRRKDDMEYIVERGGLTGVNVINRNPNNGISFKDMMERLKRIGRKKNDKG